MAVRAIGSRLRRPEERTRSNVNEGPKTSAELVRARRNRRFEAAGLPYEQRHWEHQRSLPAMTEPRLSFLGWPNGPRNHTAQDTVAQDQSVEQHGAEMGEKGQKQEVSEYRVGLTQRGVQLRHRGENGR